MEVDHNLVTTSPFMHKRGCLVNIGPPRTIDTTEENISRAISILPVYPALW